MSDNISDVTLKKVQAASGLTFSLFLCLHLTNTFTANFGSLAYDGVQHIFRKFYQNPLCEAILLGSLVVHFVSSSISVYKRVTSSSPSTSEHSKDSIASYFSLTNFNPAKFHRLTGYFLSIFIGGHVIATRFLPLYFNFPVSFAYISSASIDYPFVFYPYYFLLGASGFYHLSYGMWRSFQIFQVKTPSILSPYRKPFKIAMATGALLVLSSILAFGGNYFAISDFELAPSRAYNNMLIQKVMG